jgi:rhomboid protease GluP
MLRRLRDDFQEFPATMVFCALWVAVFVLMVLHQMTLGSVPTFHKLVLGVRGGHVFGEMTINDLLRGEIWRPLTATFVHYGLLHIGMNLFMMYHLGAMVETWYGPWQLLLVYVVTGTGGNLFSALMRYALGSDPMAASGGGSTVVLGLVALCAVVGWRSRTQIGSYLRSQMVGLLLATAVLGQIVPFIDNWGHAGGALFGAAIGFAHRTLIRTAHRPMARWAGSLGVLLLIAAGAAQIRVDRLESSAMTLALSRRKAAEKTPQILQEIGAFYHQAAKRSRFEHAVVIAEAFRRAPTVIVPESTQSLPSFVKPLTLFDSSDEEFRAALKRQVERLDALRGELGSGPTTPNFERVRTLLSRVLERLPSDRIEREFEGHLGVLMHRARVDSDSARAQVDTLRH